MPDLLEKPTDPLEFTGKRFKPAQILQKPCVQHHQKCTLYLLAAFVIPLKKKNLRFSLPSQSYDRQPGLNFSKPKAKAYLHNLI